MKNIRKYIISFFILVLLVFPVYYIHAASIELSPSGGSYNIGDTINVKVYTNTNSKAINAIAANIKFSPDTLSLSSISKTSSIINLWAQEPSFSNEDGVASFEGVILNGYTGSAGNAITLVFRAKAVGNAMIKFNTASILANDGNGTEALTNKGTSNLKILATENKPIVVKVENKTSIKKDEILTKIPKFYTTIAISEIKNNTEEYSPNKFLITSPQPVADKTYSIQIDSGDTIIWTDDGAHIFQAPELTNGIHTIKVMAVDVSSNALSGFLNFSTTILKLPVITYYPKDLYVDQFMVLKGTADPVVDVELNITNTTTGGIAIDHVTTNSDGKFTYVPDYKMLAGPYSIIARANAQNGIHSKYMDPIQVINKEHQLSFFVGKFSYYITILIPLIALIFLVILITMYLTHRLKKLRSILNKKIIETEDIVSKSFDILDEDVDDEITIFKKIRTGKLLDKEEQIFLDKFKKDIKEAEKVIKKELKDVEKAKSRI